ncbi:MAG: [FeFe] hydrogenase H-cluster maturation GTPase HydF [Candidatus Kapabacteria bacterium]|nr:[FeFe] hydrogenase H-cluster maturation GTPase HydF [Candidatus Kapabacteria bacterium]
MSQKTERDILAIIGRTNAGKSSLLNLLSGQENFAIVDPTPGTTTDTVVTLIEIHGIGPCKILDTAGVDEYSELGDKKRKKTYQAIDEADLSLIMINVEKVRQANDLEIEKELIHYLRYKGKQVLLLLNDFGKIPLNPALINEADNFQELLNQVNGELGIPSIILHANDFSYQSQLVDFIKNNYINRAKPVDLLPSLNDKGIVLLIVPMDEETPELRLLRPQEMAVERLLRNYIVPVLFRLNLAKARNSDPLLVNEEYERYTNLVNHLKKSPEGLQLIITDSQAFDIIPKWTPDDVSFTSFSIMMANYMSHGNLEFMVEGVQVVDSIVPGDKILIAESCNHDRKCDDIGTVQIPRIFEKKIAGKLNFDFNFGSPFPEDLKQYKLIIHCGSCMIDQQKYLNRIETARQTNIPFTNYGLFLAYMQNKEVIKKAVKPFIQ